jgi:hypothetical protein
MKQDENIQRIDNEETLTLMSTPVDETASRRKTTRGNRPIWAELEPHTTMRWTDMYGEVY